MSLSRAVGWWEEWQLRILVLGSLAIQLFLAVVAPFRKWSGILKLYRLAVWLSYLGGDALAIYALATLFNRQKKLQYSSSSSSLNDDDDGSGRDLELEVLWAPILLMHLGGRMTISAYNIEDNELWLRHVGVAISQVTVSVYVFWTTWSPSADKRLFAAAVLLFVLGAVRCFENPLALRRASFNNLVTSFSRVQRTEINTNREVELEQYIQDARDIIIVQSSNNQQQADQDPVPTLEKATRKSHMEKLSMADKLFVDYAFDYSVRLEKLKSLWLLDSETAFKAVRGGLSKTFNLIYTKLWRHGFRKRGITLTPTTCVDYLSIILLCIITLTFPIASIVLFHISHKEAYRGSDIKVTYLLLYITYFSEIISVPARLAFLKAYTVLLAFLGYPPYPFVEVEQHNLIHVLVDKRKRRWILITCCCQDFLQQSWFGRRWAFNWRGKEITSLVIAHAEDAWKNHMKDIESYWNLSDSRGHWTLERNGCQEIGILWDSLEKPFDESIILWHLATDLCDLGTTRSADPNKPASLCRVISNYMMYLLCANTEMLLPGSRTSLFKDACIELDAILKSQDGKHQSLTETAAKSQKGFLHDAWALAQGLMQLPGGADAGDDNNKMWKVIKGVWVEMLCFSAGRCRGFLHAKNLAYGGELLTYVALLMSNAGLETFADRQRRMQLPLSKEERLKRAKRIEQDTDHNLAAGAVVDIQEENAATPSTASALAQGECTTAPALEVVVVEAV